MEDKKMSPRKLTRNITYPSYQLWATVENKRTPQETAMVIAILTSLSWLRKKFSEMQMPEKLIAPEPDQYQGATLYDFNQLHIDCGYTLDIVSLPDEKVWSLRLIEPDYGFNYVEDSADYERFTDRIEPFGMDECWLDVTGCKICGSPMDIAENIRTTVKEELGLTVSIGCSFNKIFAKLGSDMKKPDAITEITPENFKEKVWPLPASDLLYVGRSTERRLTNYGIHTIGEVAALSSQMLKSWFGINGVALWQFANGTDSSRVMHKDFVSPVKSIGHGITCVADLNNNDEVWKVMLELSQDIGHKLRVHELTARAVQVAVRGNDLFGLQFQCKLPFSTQAPTEIAKTAFKIFEQRYLWKTPIRAVTVRAIDLAPKDDTFQLSLFNDYKKIEAREHIDDAVESIRARFGKQAITYCTLLTDLKMPNHGEHEIVMPSPMYR